jgi:hypothetical protein
MSVDSVADTPPRTGTPSADTSAPACEVEDMVDEEQHVLASSSRKYSASDSLDSLTRARAPGGCSTVAHQRHFGAFMTGGSPI